MQVSTLTKIVLGIATVFVTGAVIANSLYLAKIDHLNAESRLTPKQRKLLELQDLHSTVTTFINDPHYAEYRTLLATASTRCTEAKQPDTTEEALVDAVTYIKGILYDVNDLMKSQTAD